MASFRKEDGAIEKVLWKEWSQFCAEANKKRSLNFDMRWLKRRSRDDKRRILGEYLGYWAGYVYGSAPEESESVKRSKGLNVRVRR